MKTYSHEKVREMRDSGIIEIARKHGVEIYESWGHERYCSFKMKPVGMSRFKSIRSDYGNDFISLNNKRVDLLVRQKDFLKKIERLAEALEEAGFTVTIEEDFS